MPHTASHHRHQRVVLHALILLLFALWAPQATLGGILGMERLEIDFCKPSARSKATWSPNNKLTLTKQGLGWKGEARSSWDGWIRTAPLAIGTSWRPTRSARLQVYITPAPQPVKLANGQSYTPHGGQVFARFSPDKRHWSTWQMLQHTKNKKALVFTGSLGIPRQASAHYNTLRNAYMRRNDVPWKSDEEALVRSIVKRDPRFFRKHKPFIGYVQLLWEGSFRGGQRLRSLKLSATYAISGIHYPPKDKSVQKQHKGPWRFVHPSNKPTPSKP